LIPVLSEPETQAVMNLWWTNIVKDYLTFTPKERRGIFIAIFLIVSSWIIFRYIPVTMNHVDEHAFQQELARLKIIVDSTHPAYAIHPPKTPHYPYPLRRDNNALTGELFPFDPNTLNAAGWKKLGVKDRTIQTIENFIAKGYQFRKPDDIRRIYGMGKAEADRLVPFVRVPEKGAAATVFEKPSNLPARTEVERHTFKIIDINQADTTEFISLPGIGSKLAARIVHFRASLGGFYRIDQVGETYGIPDSTFRVIKDRLKCINPPITKININTANATELKKHPYFNWNIANAIVNYRTQHGNYKSVDDLHKIDIIGDELLNKITPYLEL
jgi:competence protein ComEA